MTDRRSIEIPYICSGEKVRKSFQKKNRLRVTLLSGSIVGCESPAAACCYIHTAATAAAADDATVPAIAESSRCKGARQERRRKLSDSLVVLIGTHRRHFFNIDCKLL